MKASIFLIAISAGVAIAQPTSLDEREGSAFCYSGADVPACCFLHKYGNEESWRYPPYLVCLRASNADNELDFIKSCTPSSERLNNKPLCCYEDAISEDEHSPSRGGTCVRPKFLDL